MQLVMLFGERKITRITDNSRAITLHLTIATGKLVKKQKLSGKARGFAIVQMHDLGHAR